ncbi:MAG: IS110 family transposase [Nitrospirota bacterium]
MYYAGLDVASKSSYVYVVDRRGRKVESKEIPTDKEGYRGYLRKWKDKVIEVALEAGGHSRWIYDLLTKMGVGVYVVNPNKVKLIAETKRKTDKVDAKVLAELLRIEGLPEKIHMAEGDIRELRDLLRARQQLVKSATSLMNQLRGLLRQEGVKLKAEAFRDGEIFEELKKSKDIPLHLKPVIESYRRSIEELLRERGQLDEVIGKYKNNEIELLKSVPGVGEVASKTIYAAIDTVKRFGSAKKLTSYCGLVPSVRSSRERTEYGHITREERSEVRGVVKQGAHAVLRSKSAESRPLRVWHEQVAKRRGFKTALVGLALIQIMFYVLRDRRQYDYRLLSTR